MFEANGRGHRARVLVAGAGGFIGHHLTRALVEAGYWVRGVDLKEPEYEPSAADEFLVECDRPSALQVDGEDLGDVGEARFTCERSSLDVIVG